MSNIAVGDLLSNAFKFTRGKIHLRSTPNSGSNFTL